MAHLQGSRPGEATTMATTKKPTVTFMLHDPETMASAGKYNSNSHRNAALKAASKGFTDIHLRQTKTKTVFHYEGSTMALAEPKLIQRGGRTIPYSKKRAAKFIRSYEYQGAPVDEEQPRTRKKAAKAGADTETDAEASPDGSEASKE